MGTLRRKCRIGSTRIRRHPLRAPTAMTAACRWSPSPGERPPDEAFMPVGTLHFRPRAAAGWASPRPCSPDLRTRQRRTGMAARSLAMIQASLVFRHGQREIRGEAAVDCRAAPGGLTCACQKAALWLRLKRERSDETRSGAGGRPLHVCWSSDNGGETGRLSILVRTTSFLYVGCLSDACPEIWISPSRSREAVTQHVTWSSFHGPGQSVGPFGGYSCFSIGVWCCRPRWA
jgi:hypothetical protein